MTSSLCFETKTLAMSSKSSFEPLPKEIMLDDTLCFFAIASLSSKQFPSG